MGAVGDTVVELMADVTMEGMTDAGVEVAVKDAEEKREEKEKDAEAPCEVDANVGRGADIAEDTDVKGGAEDGRVTVTSN